MTTHLFAVERYDDTHGSRPAAVPSVLSHGVHLACAVHLPADDAVLALVEARDEATVRVALADAAWRFDRIVAGEWIARPSLRGDAAGARS